MTYKLIKGLMISSGRLCSLLFYSNFRRWSYTTGKSGAMSSKSNSDFNHISTSQRDFSTQYSNFSLQESGTRDLSYESAIRSLNALQSNAATLQKIRKERQKHVHLNLPQTRLYLERSGITQHHLDSLNIIHVSGTKGKGSTCAFCESILRQYGLRTGFYSSPHLVSATERVRLDGEPVSKQKFTEYFWQVYDQVCRGRGPEDRPPYFQFLTVLAFNIFIRENVDVAIIEVGIGGEYDCTNIIQKPVVTGITGLGLDHTNILGNTISEIAWHKAGIMKKDTPMFIDGEQSEDALKVIKARSRELGTSSLGIIPKLNQFHWGRYPVVLGLHGEVQQRNASLALTLAQEFLARTNLAQAPELDHNPDGQDKIDIVQPFSITGKMAAGLRETDWAGRTQVIEDDKIQYFLDGAHTEESVVACASWFNQVSLQLAKPTQKIFKVMIFNTSGDRDPRVLLSPLTLCHLDLVIFTTNLSGLEDAVDQQNFTTTDQIQLSRCKSHVQVWTKLHSDRSAAASLDLPSQLHHNQSISSLSNAKGETVPCMIIPLIQDALHWLSNQVNNNQMTGNKFTQVEGTRMADSLILPVPEDLVTADKLQVLTTGSLHLVGGVLACLQEQGVQIHRRTSNNTQFIEH